MSETKIQEGSLIEMAMKHSTYQLHVNIGPRESLSFTRVEWVVSSYCRLSCNLFLTALHDKTIVSDVLRPKYMCESSFVDFLPWYGTNDAPPPHSFSSFLISSGLILSYVGMTYYGSR